MGPEEQFMTIEFDDIPPLLGPTSYAIDLRKYSEDQYECLIIDRQSNPVSQTLVRSGADGDNAFKIFEALSLVARLITEREAAK